MFLDAAVGNYGEALVQWRQCSTAPGASQILTRVPWRMVCGAGRASATMVRARERTTLAANCPSLGGSHVRDVDLDVPSTKSHVGVMCSHRHPHRNDWMSGAAAAAAPRPGRYVLHA